MAFSRFSISIIISKFWMCIWTICKLNALYKKVKTKTNMVNVEESAICDSYYVVIASVWTRI